MAEMFVYYKNSKTEFISAGLESKYTNYIVFIKGDNYGNGSCIYTHGMYFANFLELLSTINYVKGISVNGTFYNALAGGGYLAFGAKDPTTVEVKAGSHGIEIGLTEAFIQKVDNVIEVVSTINNDYLKQEDKEAINQLITELSNNAVGNKLVIGRDVADSTSGEIIIGRDTTITDAIEIGANRIPNIGRVIKDSSTEEEIISANTSITDAIDIAINHIPVGRIGRGLTIKENKLTVDLDESEGNTLYLTPEGKLRSDKLWENWKN